MSALRVLLVDDNPDDRALVERELRGEWPEVQIAEATDMASLQAAIDVEQVDVVVTDYNLRFTDGLDVLRRVRGAHPDCPVVMFTGTGSEEIAVDAMKHGLDDYVLKHHIRRLAPAIRAVLARRELERSAEYAEARHRDLFFGAPIGILYTDPDGVVLDANPALLSLTAVRSVDELNAFAHEELYADPADAARWKRLADAGVLRGFTFQMRSRDGSPLWVRITGRALRGRDGVVESYELAAEDVTAEHVLLESLKESEERFRALADATSVMIWVSNERHEDVYLNRGWLDFRGRTLEEELYDGWREGVHPDDLESADAAYYGAIYAHVEYRGEYRLRHHSGEYRTVVDYGVPRFDTDGSFRGYVGTTVDVTDLLAAEREAAEATSLLDSALEGAPVGIGWVDPDLRYVRVNETLARYSGLDAADAVGRTVADVLAASGIAEAVEKAYRHVLETGESLGDVELRRETPEGTRCVVASFYPVRANGDVVGAGVAFIDATETRRLQDQLFEAQKHETVGQFAAGIAHDFNNVLTAIDGYAALLESELSGDPRERRVAEIRGGARRGADLVRRLMGFVARTPLLDTPVDVAAVAAETISMLRSVVPAVVDLKLTTADAPVWALAGGGRLAHVLTNFVLNAVDAMPEGGAVTITVEASESTVEVRVKDDGTGISPEVLPFIWDPLFTTKTRSSETLGGSGLGLSSVRGIVEQLGGAVDVRSAVGEGSTFFVRLPRLPAEEAGETEAGELVPAPRGSASVLVAEDEELLLELYRTVLERAGYDVVTSKDGQEAVALAGDVDLVIADAEMPGLGGAELRLLLVERGMDVPVLLVSGNEVEQVEGADPASFLHKPFTPAALTAKVRELLGG